MPPLPIVVLSCWFWLLALTSKDDTVQPLDKLDATIVPDTSQVNLLAEVYPLVLIYPPIIITVPPVP